MAKLVWKGKNKGAASASASRATRRVRAEELYGDVAPGGWRNRLVLGDATGVLGGLSDEMAGKVALAYIDPPFVTGSDFDFQASIPGAPADAARVAVRAYRDAPGIDAWLAWFHAVALSLRELLAPGGSLYVHLDAHVSHYAKVLLDEVFGAEAFQREIVWRIGWISGFKSRARNWVRNHDTILFYAKGGRGFTFHKEYVPYPKGYVRRDGAAPRGEGYPIEDVWNASGIDRMDSIQIMSFSGEKVGYPTQKNESLISRIVRASSNPDDLVLDCFVGSGTTAVVAEKLGRKWIACDASPIAIHASRKRLLSVPAIRPLAVERLGPAAARASGGLAVDARVDGRRCTIELTSFTLSRGELLPDAAAVAHWSQWIEDWCVDWDHRKGPIRVQTRVVRRPKQAQLALQFTHSYERSGRYVVAVKAYDVLGGSTLARVAVVVH